MHKLDGPRLKLQWAEKHLIALDAEIDTFHKSDPAIFTIEKKPDKGIQVLRIEFPSSRVPLDIGIIAGHAVLDMRSALNWLVCALWDEQGRNFLGDAEFPIFKSRPGSNFERKVRFIPDEAKEVIRLSQPYYVETRYGHRADIQRLWELHQLANMDRHRGIIVRGVMGVLDIPADPCGRHRPINRPNDTTLEVIMSIGDNDFDPKPTFDVTFGAENVPGIVTANSLWQMHDMIAKVIFPMLTAHFPD